MISPVLVVALSDTGCGREWLAFMVWSDRRRCRSAYGSRETCQEPTRGLEADHTCARHLGPMVIEEDRTWWPEQTKPFEERLILSAVRRHIGSEQSLKVKRSISRQETHQSA